MIHRTSTFDILLSAGGLVAIIMMLICALRSSPRDLSAGPQAPHPVRSASPSLSPPPRDVRDVAGALSSAPESDLPRPCTPLGRVGVGDFQGLTGLGGSLDTLGAKLDPQYAPSHERWMDRAGSLERALEASPEDLAGLDLDFWEKHLEWKWLLDKDFAHLTELFPIDIQGELEADWKLPDTQALWAVHQELFHAQANLVMLSDHADGQMKVALEDELMRVRAKLAELREAMWSTPDTKFLWSLSEALR